MAQSFLIFDFGSNEEAAQQARHTIERWKQAFRLDRKLLLKFDREEREEAAETKEPSSKPTKKRKAKAAEESGEDDRILLMVRLDFSDHERLSHQRWLERIPAEAPFKDAHPKVIRGGDAEFAGAAESFDALD